jgi:hypothetical protein
VNLDALELAGLSAVAEAERLWALDIIDPPIGSTHPRAAESLAVINAIIKTNGWAGNVKYLGNGPPQWCGMFAGACWAKAGLDPAWLASYWASTYRIGLWARYKRFSPASKPNPIPMTGVPRRLIARLDRGKPLSFVPRAGDIVIVGDGEPDDGDHVTLNVRYDSVRRVFETLSGNGGGGGPRGNKREGISRRDYGIDAGTGYRAMWLVRPAPSDLIA